MGPAVCESVRAESQVQRAENDLWPAVTESLPISFKLARIRYPYGVVDGDYSSLCASVNSP